jgi:uncharacterized protein
MTASTQRADFPLAVHRAEGFWHRLLGLLGRPELRKGEALYLAPCNGVHTLFMPYRIDVVFVDRSGLVLHVVADLAPWRFRFCRGAHAALELRAGQALHYSIARGIRLPEDIMEAPRQ